VHIRESGDHVIFETLSVDEGALMQQILHMPQRQWLTDRHHHREADDLGQPAMDGSRKNISDLLLWRQVAIQANIMCIVCQIDEAGRSHQR
jgi:hypothetical protein